MKFKKTKAACTMVHVKQRVDNVVKSVEDKRNYRGLLLQNDLKVLLISDPTTDKAAAAMDVHIGHMSDPKELPGLAHFCEHMLFLGTEKYPLENEYSKYLSEHGGSSNASTSSDHTNFFFDITNEFLPGALDRFAQFFLCPLFTESATDREVNAVNSEHEKNISSDVWRLDQLEKSTAEPSHPYNHFGTGNKLTLDKIPKELGLNVRDELLKFHDKWYSSNIMALAILGKEDLDTLEEMVVNLFSGVKNKNVTAPNWPDHPYGPKQLQMKGLIVPVKDLRNLNIIFAIPDLHDYKDFGPDEYLSHLLGHEGPGSLLSELKSRGYCNSLVGGVRNGAKGFAFFGIDVDLTEEGIEHVDSIVKLLFQYIAMLRKEGPQEWIFNECKEIMAIHFRFKDKEMPRNYVSRNSENLHEYSLEEVLCGSYLLKEWKPKLVDEVLSYLTPTNVRVAVIGKKFQNEAVETEKWYGTKYKMERISSEKIKDWSDGTYCETLQLPTVNEFIPTNFSILPREENSSQYPVVIKETPLFRVWFKQDDEFLLPKAYLSFEFVSPLAYLDPCSCNMTYMFVLLFKDALNEYAYAATLAGLKWELTNTKYGMVLGVAGYNDKEHALLNKIIVKLTNFQIDPKRFDILRENYIRGLKNFEAEQPYQHAIYYLAVLLSEHAWTKKELLAACQDLTLDKMQAFIPQMLSHVFIECLIHGNIDHKTALSLIQMVEEQMTSSASLKQLLPRQLLRNREVRLADGSDYVYEVENNLHRSSCAENFYQSGLMSTESNMVLELLVQIITEPCFNTLRTKEQLGYIVFNGVRRSNGVQGLRIIVQSDKHPAFVDSRIEEFLVQMKDLLENLSEEEFVCHREALAAQRLEKPKRLNALTARFWSEITSHQYNFDRTQIEVAYLRTLTKDDVIKFFTEIISKEAPNRHKLSVQVISTAEGGAGNQQTIPDDLQLKSVKIEDITRFKSSQSLFPLVQPFINITSATKSKL